MNLTGSVRQAVILAGGSAKRLRPYTQDKPKSLLEVAGKPIVERQIAWLRSSGVHQIVVSCGRMSNVLQDHLGDGSTLGVEIDYAVEPEALGRGGGLKFAAAKLPQTSERWMGLNGDVLCNFSVSSMVELHEQAGALATIALAPYQSSWGLVELSDDLVTGFNQSPKLPYWINGGVYCFEPSVTGLLPDTGDHEDSTFPELAESGRLAGYRITGYWRGIDTVKDLELATKELEEK